MENVVGFENDREKNRRKNQFSDSVENVKRIYKVGQKVVKFARWLFNFFPGGVAAFGIIIVFVILVFLFLTIVFGLLAPIPGGKPPRLPSSTGAIETIPGLTLRLTGPAPVDNGANMEFTIDVSYSATSPPLSSIIVYAVIPPVAEFVEATGAFEYKNGEIVWPMSQNSNRLTFTLKATAVDIEYKDYVVYAVVASGSGPGAGLAPTNDSCSGKYNIASSPVGQNFGDPGCNFTKDDLYALLQQLDPSSADRWYFKIVPCESGYNPNAYNGAAVDAAGAYGLYQMGRGKNGQYDHGDVDWATQTSNAVTYNKNLIGGSFAYWACK